MGFPFSFEVFRRAEANHGWNEAEGFDISTVERDRGATFGTIHIILGPPVTIYFKREYFFLTYVFTLLYIAIFGPKNKI